MFYFYTSDTLPHPCTWLPKLRGDSLCGIEGKYERRADGEVQPDWAEIGN